MNRNVLGRLLYSNILQAGIDDDECQDKSEGVELDGSANIVSEQELEDEVHRCSRLFILI